VGDDEEHEDRCEDLHRLANAAQVEHNEEREAEELGREFVRKETKRKDRPELIARARDRHGDGKDVVDEERAAADDADPVAEEFRRHEVSAAAARKVLDQVRVGDGDDSDRDDGHRDDDNREMRVRAERLVSLLGAVGRRREAVRSQADPREDRDEGDVVEDVGIGDVARRTDDDAAKVQRSPSRCGAD
jgi:hypothetical protein